MANMRLFWPGKPVTGQTWGSRGADKGNNPSKHSTVRKLDGDVADLDSEIILFPKYRGVDTMCAVGANGCIVGAY